MTLRAVISTKYKFIFALEECSASEWWRIVTNDFRYDLEAMDGGDKLNASLLERFPEYRDYSLLVCGQSVSDSEIGAVVDQFHNVFKVCQTVSSSTLLQFLSSIGWMATK